IIGDWGSSLTRMPGVVAITSRKSLPAKVGNSFGFTNEVFLPALILVPSTGGNAGYGTGYVSNHVPVTTIPSNSVVSSTLVTASDRLSLEFMTNLLFALTRLPLGRERGRLDLSSLP